MTKYTTIVSPFFGGGSFEFYLQNKYKKHVIANDKFIPLYNFWNQVKLYKEEICEKLKEKRNISKLDFDNYRKDIMQLTVPKNQAIYFLLLIDVLLVEPHYLEDSQKKLVKKDLQNHQLIESII